MDRQEQRRALQTFRRRLFNAIFLKTTVLFSTVLLFCWGVAVLAARVGGLDDRRYFFYALFAFLLVPPLAGIFARRRMPGNRFLASILDRDNEAGGLYMSSFERDIGDWERRLESIEVPRIRWQAKRTWGLVAAAVGFALTSLLFPVASVSGSNAKRLNVEDQVRRLTTQLDVLGEENLLDVEEIEARKLEMEKIRETADGLGPVKTFDALDHIADRMRQKAAEAVENAQRTVETLAEAEALSQLVKELVAELDEPTARSLMDGLAETLEKMLEENGQLAEDLAKALAEQKKNAGENGRDARSDDGEKSDALTELLRNMLKENKMQGLDSEMLRQLCEAMTQCQDNSERMCDNLQNANFPIDREMLEKLAESRRIEREEAQRMLSELWANCDACDGKECPGQPGEQRISPRFTQKQDWTTDPDAPPEDARYLKAPDEEGAEFKAKFLPPSEWEAFRNSQKIGSSIAAPEFDPQGNAGDHGGAIGDTGGGIGAAHGQTVYPQHRGPVGRYFEK